MQNGQLSFTELILNASLLVQLVMFFLLSLSVISWTIIIQRSSAYKQGRARADEFEDRFWSGIDLNNLYQDCIKRQQDLQGLEVIYTAGFKEFVRLVNSGPADQEVVMDGTYRQMKVAESREVESLESHLATLATIGSISPYIGLFGTVWGIMHAFVALAAVKNATLSMVAPPIAEALIATAMGLFAAIPAVMFYNHFVSKCEALENRYDNFMDEFATILNRRLVTVRSQLKREQERKEQEEAASRSRPAPARNDGYGYQQRQQEMTRGYAQPAPQPQRYQAPGAAPQYRQPQAPQPQRQQAYEQRQPQGAPHYITPGVQPQPAAPRGVQNPDYGREQR
jgi:biopolymer transport protein TolQ